MKEIEFQDKLADALTGERFDDVVDVSTFEEAGLLTNNKGLVIYLVDGSSFQVTIVKQS